MSFDELSDIRRRLAEAEETIRAIRTGEVDALVVSGTDSDQIFDIGSDTESYRAFMEVMDIGAAALDDGGRILYLNSSLASVLNVTAESAQGQTLTQVMSGSAAEAIANLWNTNPDDAGTVQVDLGNGQFIVAAKPLRLGTVAGFAVTFTDVTERVRSETAVQSERAARAVIASANEAVLVCDRDGIITHANAAAGIVYAGNPIGQAFADAVPLTFPGATGLMQSEDIIAMAVGGTSVQGIEAVAPNAPSVSDYLISAAPLQVGNDAISGCVITMVDLSQRKAAEKQQFLLMRELDHRVKNTLALVLSISGRTLHHEDTLEGFQRAFTGRIQALAATHNLLAENSWSNLTLSDVVQNELAPYLGGGPERVIITGLDIAVEPRAAIAFGLVIHELTTNAAKYGALSVPDGLVSVAATSRTQGEGGSLTVEWLESGGPSVEVPTRKGFGQSVITRSLQYSPGGGAEIDYRPRGLFCSIRVPSEDLI